MFLLFLYITAVFLGLINKKGRLSFFFSFFVAWLLMAGNYQNADYENYIIRYESGLNVLLDPGFSLINQLFSDAGFSFAGFKTVLSFFCLILIFRTISKLSAKNSLGAAFFLLFPLIIDITQFRNFVAYSVFYSAVPYLFETTKTSTIKYLVITLAAVSIHMGLFFYLILPFAKKNIKVIYVLLGVIALFVGKEILIALFQEYFMTNKLDRFDRPSFLGAALGTLVVVLNAIIINTLYCKRFKYRGIVKNNVICINRVWVNVNWLLLFVIPFLFENGNYSRMFRNFILLNVILVSNTYYLRRQTKVLVIASVLLYFVFTNYFLGSYYNDIFMPVFSYNSVIPK